MTIFVTFHGQITKKKKKITKYNWVTTGVVYPCIYCKVVEIGRD